jgi:hypothetical protein
MENEIEAIDQRRRSYLRGYLIPFIAFMIFMIIRFFFRAGDLNKEPVGIAVLVGLIIAVAVQAYYMIRLSLLQKSIRSDPVLKEALDNEMVRLYEIKSWKAAYIAAIGAAFFFAFASFFYPVCDPVLVALAATIAGAGAYRASFYILYRD